MATIVYKDGVASKVEPHALQRHLDNGYSLTNEPEEKPKPKPKPKAKPKAKPKKK